MDAFLVADRGDIHDLESRQLELKEMTRASRAIVRQLFWFGDADRSHSDVSLCKMRTDAERCCSREGQTSRLVRRPDDCPRATMMFTTANEPFALVHLIESDEWVSCRNADSSALIKAKK